MLHELRGRLRDVRIRQRLDRAMRWGLLAVIVAAALGSLLTLAAWLGVPVDAGGVWKWIAGAAALAGVAGGAWPTTWQSSARLVDACYGLKDRALTALDFASRPDHDPLHTLQMHDALEHLSVVDARRVVPWTTGRLVPAAVTALGVMIALGLLPMAQRSSEATAPAGPLDVVLDQAAFLEETMLEELDELAKESTDPEVENLAEEMKAALEELKEPDVDQREALAKLSEMQAELAAAVKALDVEQIDAQLKALAEALQVSDATEAASHALKADDYDRAAGELEKIDASTMTKKQKNALAANMAKLASNLGTGKKGQLGEAVQEVAEGLADEDQVKFREGMCNAAGVCRKQGVRKKVSDCLACQLNRLSECKSKCQSACQGPNGSSAQKSDAPSNVAGRSASNRPMGEDKTKLDSRRREEHIEGTPGEGPSDRETLSIAEARQHSARGYRERYTEFRKQMEEVLDREPLPLGHRETVRRYFEAIRPGAESEATTPP
jgi:hypothetical protein